ncbi:MBL fold metallo-hydrolase [Niallia oryzisoli]|uniref:MBL fold metallo-hydrolase n=1 Tax=Niallia oryzisoli TaxID=1737571 RepID=A0ABZ2C887_9BACI
MLKVLGIQRIKIDLPFKLDHIYCFLAKGEEGWKILDTGLHNEKAIETWRPHLTGKNITDIIISHCHPDHIGYAGQLQKETNALVWMSETDAVLSPLLWSDDSSKILHQRYISCGVDHKTINKLSSLTDPLVFPLPKVSGYLKDGDTIMFGNYPYEVIETPGHTDGLFVLYNKEKKVLLSTDHILPKITPNISLRSTGDSNPLESYFQSLSKMRSLDVEYVIPSHGEPFSQFHQRVEELEKHHHERLEFILTLLDQPKTAFQVCEQLFRENLTIHELRFAIGETLSHLVYLINKGLCQRTEENGIWYYVR